MALTSSEVRVAVTGTVGVGPTSVTPPTSADGTVTGINDLGYVSSDGITETRDRSTNKITAWQNADTVREVVTDSTLTLKFVMIQTNKDTIELYYGSAVDTSDGSVAIIPAQTGGRKSFVFDIVDDDDFIRIYVPSGEVTAVGDQVYQSGEAIGYDVTITCYPATVGGTVMSAKKFYSSLVDES